jgi:hypothetical protein
MLYNSSNFQPASPHPQPRCHGDFFSIIGFIISGAFSDTAELVVGKPDLRVFSLFKPNAIKALFCFA